MKIAIVGAAGRMGKMLCRLAEGTSLEVVSKVDVAEGYDREWSGDVENAFFSAELRLCTFASV